MNLIIDDGLKYCLDCEEEYRAEIEQCADCGASLLTGLALQAMQDKEDRVLAGRSMEIHPDDELVTVRKGPIVQMKGLQNLLAKASLPSILSNNQSDCGKGCFGADVLLKVRREDVEAVTALLDAEHVSTTSLAEYDTSNVGIVFNTMDEQATCPACGCSFPTSTGSCPDCGLYFSGEQTLIIDN